MEEDCCCCGLDAIFTFLFYNLLQPSSNHSPFPGSVEKQPTSGTIRFSDVSMSVRTSSSKFSLTLRDADVCKRKKFAVPMRIRRRSCNARIISSVTRWQPRDLGASSTVAWNHCVAMRCKKNGANLLVMIQMVELHVCE